MSRSVIGQFLSPSDLHVWSGHVASLCGLSVTGLILCGPMEVVTQLCALFSAISTISGLPMQSWSWSYCEVHLGGGVPVPFYRDSNQRQTRCEKTAKTISTPKVLSLSSLCAAAAQQDSRTAGQRLLHNSFVQVRWPHQIWRQCENRWEKSGEYSSVYLRTNQKASSIRLV